LKSESTIISQSRVAPGVVSEWHHHRTLHLYGFVISGLLQLEYFQKGKEIADVNLGDFFHIPPGLVHRDLNPNKEREVVVVNILVGSGLAVINLESPSRGD
jgi:uncharacterized RmlC-like cupin family protein